jgi:hypothetical protein
MWTGPERRKTRPTVVSNPRDREWYDEAERTRLIDAHAAFRGCSRERSQEIINKAYAALTCKGFPKALAYITIRDGIAAAAQHAEDAAIAIDDAETLALLGIRQG